MSQGLIPVEGSARLQAPELASPFPLIDQLPAMLAEDPFLQRMMPALDSVIAPVIAVMDCFEAYLDPWTAPMDMVQFVGSWMLSQQLEEDESESARRARVATAAQRYRFGGTTKCIEDTLVPREARRVRITDSGGVIVSEVATDRAQWPAPLPAQVLVEFEPLDHHDSTAIERVRRIVRRIVPAHVAVEVVDSL